MCSIKESNSYIKYVLRKNFNELNFKTNLMFPSKRHYPIVTNWRTIQILYNLRDGVLCMYILHPSYKQCRSNVVKEMVMETYILPYSLEITAIREAIAELLGKVVRTTIQDSELPSFYT